MVKLKPYPAYKDSGVPWLGPVPAHWEVVPNRTLFKEVNERHHPHEPLLSVTIAHGVVPQATLLAGSSKKDASNVDKTAYKLVLPGDIVYNKMRAWQGALGRSRYRGIVSPAYVVMRPRGGCSSEYYHYLMRTPGFTTEAERWSYGITSDQWSLRPEHFRLIYTTFPPMDEQHGIVRFLGHVDSIIRRYIRAKQKQIALLNEHKQVIVRQAVTQGMDPTVRLKHSGVEWIGELPEHWDVKSLGALTSLIQTGPFGSQLHSGDYVVGGIPVINPAHMREGKICADPKVSVTSEKARQLARHRLHAGDIVSARRGELGRCAVVGEEHVGWLCGTGSLLIRPRPELADPSYLAQVLNSSGARAALSMSSRGATMDNLSASRMASLRVPVPPLHEQCAIVDYIKRQVSAVEAIVTSAQREIFLLREYRTRLIADVVTGKFDVREAAANLPQEPDLEDEVFEVPDEEAPAEEKLQEQEEA